jgi:hypothetical protein
VALREQAERRLVAGPGRGDGRPVLAAGRCPLLVRHDLLLDSLTCSQWPQHANRTPVVVLISILSVVVRTSRLVVAMLASVETTNCRERHRREAACHLSERSAAYCQKSCRGFA